jgi:tetratricopeptide (TPR) repeat protein
LLEREESVPLTPLVLTNLAGVHLDQGHIEEAAAILERVKSIQERNNAKPVEIAKTLNNLGGVYQAAANYDAARQNYEQALRVRVQEFGHESLAVASTLNNIGDLFYQRGDFCSAEKYHSEALGIREKLLPPGHPDT